MRKTDSKVIWGILFVLFGLVLAVNRLGLIENFTIFFSGWWTLFIILPCLVQILSGNGGRASFIGLFIGVVLFLYSQRLLPIRDFFSFVAAVIFVVIGISVAFKDNANDVQKEIEKREKREREYKDKIAKEIEDVSVKTNHGNYKNFTTYLSSNRIKYVEEVFQKASITSVLGNVQLDLRNAIFEGDGVLEVTCILGGIDIYLPSNICVINHCTAIFAGVENSIMEPRNISGYTYTLHIRGSCILGGIEVK